MWETLASGVLRLQQCCNCRSFRYPPGPTCHRCASPEHKWKPVSGRGQILSWVVFHRTYFDDYPAPYNVVAVKLEEGPMIVTNLTGKKPMGSWIGRSVELCFERHSNHGLVPRVKLAGDDHRNVED
nr:OB-fold domain-containing protein [Chelativorans sp. Marseille-P2723]